jgi:hypothetical protein
MSTALAVRPRRSTDEAEDLGDRIAILGAELHAGLHRMLVLIARFDAMRYWALAGHRSSAHWLAFRVGLDLGTARERVRVARALTNLPETDAAMSRGELSFSKVRAVTRVAEAETEADLLEAARGCTARDLEYVVRAWKKGSCKDEAEWEKERHASRYLFAFPDDDGMYRVNGRLDPEVGALLMRAIEAATDALYRKRDRDELAVEDDREAAQRRADALGLLTERSLAAGFGGKSACTAACAEESETFPREHPGSEAPISGTRAERYQVMLQWSRRSSWPGGTPSPSRAGPSWRTGHAFPRKRPGGCAAMRGSCG